MFSYPWAWKYYKGKGKKIDIPVLTQAPRASNGLQHNLRRKHPRPKTKTYRNISEIISTPPVEFTSSLRAQINESCVKKADNSHKICWIKQHKF